MVVLVAPVDAGAVDVDPPVVVVVAEVVVVPPAVVAGADDESDPHAASVRPSTANAVANLHRERVEAE
jgi:hypothetical protein